MRSFQDTFKTCKRPFISAFLIYMTVPWSSYNWVQTDFWAPSVCTCFFVYISKFYCFQLHFGLPKVSRWLCTLSIWMKYIYLYTCLFACLLACLLAGWLTDWLACLLAGLLARLLFFLVPFLGLRQLLKGMY